MTMLRLLLLAGALATAAGGFSSVAVATTVLPITPSLYHDFKARGIGDVVTILIVESTSASKSASTETASRASSNGWERATSTLSTSGTWARTTPPKGEAPPAARAISPRRSPRT